MYYITVQISLQAVEQIQMRWAAPNTSKRNKNRWNTKKKNTKQNHKGPPLKEI